MYSELFRSSFIIVVHNNNVSYDLQFWGGFHCRCEDTHPLIFSTVNLQQLIATNLWGFLY